MSHADPREYLFSIDLSEAGPWYSPKMARKLINGYLAVDFYETDPMPEGVRDYAAVKATPSAGTLTFEATEHEANDAASEAANGSYGSIENGAVDCSDEAYLRPNWAGMVTYVRVTKTVAVSGGSVTHALVRIVRTA